MQQKNSSLPVRILKGFAMFWWDFLVGDTPELFVAAVLLVAITTLVRVVWQLNGWAVVVLPLLVILSLGISLRRARRLAKK